ncbi:DUF4148 domain-containing protein [Acidovorax sp. SUPP2539]|uniref:DUF4148 domain-containing protein n=1 Tax=Acidovorax sp. SUPP2539 TaxID=2920878 RepID=UPI0023DE6889|nr:DUF4148 domain-containing protein [Acidovorax sp. SUPP2539]GKS89551.1 DUF4148 domain-containing protein [Acidovorax sp. SUPP2539]
METIPMPYFTLNSSPSIKTPLPASPAAPVRLRATVAAALALASALAMPTHAQERNATQQQQPTLSRAEVIADLALWRRAGADRYEGLSRSYGLETQAYDAAQQEYLRLRQSEAFPAEVRKQQAADGQ